MSNKIHALFFSRGRGHGHAIPDMAIVDEISATRSDIVFEFASYSTGANTLKLGGRPVHDLALPENNPYLATQRKAFELIRTVRPDIVLSHEEFAALSAARLVDTPSVFISAWLPQTRSLAAESLRYANSIVMIEHPGIFPIPEEVSAPVYYAGPILRQMKYTRRDRATLRSEMGIAMDEKVVTVVPGGAASEEHVPIAGLIIAAFFRLTGDRKRLFWLSDKDAGALQKRFGNHPQIVIMDFVNPIERLLAVADLVITKGTRGITLDAAAVGVPSLSLSHGRNPIDDILVPRIRTNVALNAKAVDDATLACYIEAIIASAAEGALVPEHAGAKPAASLLTREILSLVSGREISGELPLGHMAGAS